MANRIQISLIPPGPSLPWQRVAATWEALFSTIFPWGFRWPGGEWTPFSQLSYLHSQLLGVRKEHRHLGIGFQLKLYQREFALEADLEVVQWVFDPMRSVNANLNVRKLGAVIPAYHPDYFGSLQSHFSRGLASDRVWAHWYVASSRVRQRLLHPLPLSQAGAAPGSGDRMGHRRRGEKGLSGPRPGVLSA